MGHCYGLKVLLHSREHLSRELQLDRPDHMILEENCMFLGLRRLPAHRRLVDLVVGVNIGRKRHAGGISQHDCGIVGTL